VKVVISRVEDRVDRFVKRYDALSTEAGSIRQIAKIGDEACP
jgi:hypothetical protein